MPITHFPMMLSQMTVESIQQLFSALYHYWSFKAQNYWLHKTEGIISGAMIPLSFAKLTSREFSEVLAQTFH
jgi:hypothetical protein